MSRLKLLVPGFCIILALLALFMGGMSSGEKTTTATGMPPGAAPYGARGPHQVGTDALVIGGDAPLEITMWYPTAKPGSAAPPITYSYEIKLFPPIGKLALAAYAGQAIRHAPYDLTTAPYPLVILSPGFALSSATYAWLAEHLASYGFVVISPEHDEQLDPSLLWQATIVRPQDILTVLAFIDAQSGTGGALAGLINRDLAAVIGHSYGGYTALAAGGARLDTAGFAADCQTAYAANDPLVFLCDALLPHLAGMAKLAGLDAIPEGLWPAWGDPRVKAVVSLAGDAAVFAQAGLAEVTVPVMAIGGTADKDSPYLWGTHPTYEYAASPQKVRIALNDAAHMIFTGPCEAMRRFMKVIHNEFCADPAWERHLAQDLINHFTTTFLLAELKQDASAAAALGTDAIEFPHVTYEAQGYEIDSSIP